MIFSKDKQAVQELLAHRGWDIFRSLLFQDHMMDNRQIQCLKTKLQADLLSAGRAGDGIKAAKASAQIDILDVIIDIPNKYLKG